MSRAATIRDDLIDVLEAHLTATDFTVNTFEPLATQLPIDDLKALEDPRLWLVTMGGDEQTIDRAGTWRGERGIQLILKQRVDLSDTNDCDGLETLLDELKQVCRDHGGSANFVFDGTTYKYTWRCVRIEALRDPAGTPYAYGLIRESSVFEGVFTAIYELASD